MSPDSPRGQHSGANHHSFAMRAGNASSPLADKPHGPAGHEALVHGEARHDVILRGHQHTNQSERQTSGLSADAVKGRWHHNEMLLGHFNSLALSLWFAKIAGSCHAINGIPSNNFQSL